MPQKQKTIHDLLLSFDDTKAALHLVAKFGWIDRDFFLNEVSKGARATRYRHWRLMIDLEILERRENAWPVGAVYVATKRFHQHFPEIRRVPEKSKVMLREGLVELRRGYALIKLGIPFQTREETGEAS